jgi:putative FmdB family regulatory protein
MPLFEYQCHDCGRQFEYLARAEQSPTCPSCSGANLQKLLSVFAVNTGSSSSAAASFAEGPAPCGTCGDPRGPGSCSIH